MLGLATCIVAVLAVGEGEAKSAPKTCEFSARRDRPLAQFIRTAFFLPQPALKRPSPPRQRGILRAIAERRARKNANVPEPVPGARLTDEYVREVGQFAYLWAWPMVNLHNRLEMLKRVPEPGLVGGIAPAAPLNQLCMLQDYINYKQRYVQCPNQDVVYGFGMLELDSEPVVVQVPDFGDRFWVYQVGDMRTDGFAELGSMYGTKPGFYMLVGPDWRGGLPKGITGAFRCPTKIGYVIPRVFVLDEFEDKQAVQGAVSQIMAYPLRWYDGTMKSKDWTSVWNFPAPRLGRREQQWVVPERFFDDLPATLDQAPPLVGEEAIYAMVRSVLDAAAADPHVKDVLKQAAIEAERDLIAPFERFSSFGIPLEHNWTTIRNGAAFGTDYYTRTAVAKSNIFVNRPGETAYFYQDFDASGPRLSGINRYTVTFAKGQLPPVKGFWSLTLYNENHFFVPNPLDRFSRGTKDKNLQYGEDGSLTIYVQPDPPDPSKLSNWLPAPLGEFSLYLRAYWPEASIVEGRWTPPPVVKSGQTGRPE